MVLASKGSDNFKVQYYVVPRKQSSTSVLFFSAAVLCQHFLLRFIDPFGT